MHKREGLDYKLMNEIFIVNIIIGLEPINILADINFDNDIDILDILLLVDIILS